MAITTPLEVSRRHRVAAAAGLLLAGVLVHTQAGAQSWRVTPDIKATMLGSTNIGMQNSGDATVGAVLTVTPRLQLQGTGPDYKLTGDVSADAVQYINSNQSSRILPRGQVQLNTRLVERLFFVDAELGAETSSATPFDVSGDPTSVYSVGTTTRERLSPYIDHEISPSARINARSDNLWTQGSGSSVLGNGESNAFVQTNTVRYDLLPQPTGLRAEYNRQTTTYKDGGSGLMLETARVTGLYAFDPTLTVGVTAGRDGARYTTNNVSNTLAGGMLRWTPTERTVLDALVERRFFGTGWNVNFTHRSPFMAVTAGVVRQASTFASRLGTLQAGGDVPALLDAILRTRIPDVAQRQLAVYDYMSRSGLSGTLTGPVDLYSRTVQLQQGVNVSLALIGVRHTVTFRVFRTRTEDLRGASEGLLLLASDAIQSGFTAGFNRRLTPDTAADLSLTRVKSDGFGSNAGRTSSSTVVRLGATHSLSPRTTLSGSVRFQNGSSTLTGVNASEAAVSAGVLHRF